MKAVYKRDTPCKSCIDIYGDTALTFCGECIKFHKEEVDILQFGIGFFGKKAIIKRKTGELLIVSISSLRIF